MLEQGRADVSPNKKCHQQYFHTLWQTMQSFCTGGAGFSPQSRFGKIFYVSWAFCVLLLVASYTANLASNLIRKESAEPAFITSVEDAIQKRAPVCVYKGGALEKLVVQRYPNLPLVHVSAEDWLNGGYASVRQGVCDAVVKDAFNFRLEKRTKSSNPDCDLGTIGVPLLQQSNSFVVRQDSDCSSLVMDVIDLAMQEMYNDGWLTQATDRFLNSHGDQSCSGGSSQKENPELDLTEIGGIFVTHGMISVACLVGHLILRRRRSTDPETTESKGVMPTLP